MAAVPDTPGRKRPARLSSVTPAQPKVRRLSFSADSAEKQSRQKRPQSSDRVAKPSASSQCDRAPETPERPNPTTTSKGQPSSPPNSLQGTAMKGEWVRFPRMARRVALLLLVAILMIILYCSMFRVPGWPEKHPGPERDHPVRGGDEAGLRRRSSNTESEEEKRKKQEALAKAAAEQADLKRAAEDQARQVAAAAEKRMQEEAAAKAAEAVQKLAAQERAKLASAERARQDAVADERRRQNAAAKAAREEAYLKRADEERAKQEAVAAKKRRQEQAAAKAAAEEPYSKIKGPPVIIIEEDDTVEDEPVKDPDVSEFYRDSRGDKYEYGGQKIGEEDKLGKGPVISEAHPRAPASIQTRRRATGSYSGSWDSSGHFQRS